MKLKHLIKDLPIYVKGSKEITITGITADSKTVAPGNLFIAKKGSTYDGLFWVDEAILAGASAVCLEMQNPFLQNITQLITPDVASVEATLAARFYDFPDQHLTLTGITGTNGKTTTSYMLYQLLAGLGRKAGMIGTIEYLLGDVSYPATLTTPDVNTNYRMLKEMVRANCTDGVMEVTSHALDQNRTGHLRFDTAVFTNLTQDHLDYHQTMEQYFSAKRKIFTLLKKGGCSVFNGNSPYAKELKSFVPNPFSYGIDIEANLTASHLTFDKESMVFDLAYDNQTHALKIPFLGHHNVSNFLAAVGVLLSQKVSLDAILQACDHLTPIKGRLQQVNQSGVFVDFAHTPDALKQALLALKSSCKGRLILVFGCGGNRDQEKRPLMGQVAAQYADLVIITSDNPRSEDPYEICNQVKQGCKKSCVHVEVDRFKAIEYALAEKQETDYVLIAGRGHETTQKFANQSIQLNDYEVAEKLTV